MVSRIQGAGFGIVRSLKLNCDEFFSHMLLQVCFKAGEVVVPKFKWNVIPGLDGRVERSLLIFLSPMFWIAEITSGCGSCVFIAYLFHVELLDVFWSFSQERFLYMYSDANLPFFGQWQKF